MADIVSVQDEEVARLNVESAARFNEFISQWTMETIPACDEGMALLLHLAECASECVPARRAERVHGDDASDVQHPGEMENVWGTRLDLPEVQRGIAVCGRYVRKGDKQRIAEAFHAKELPTFAMPDADYNIAPTTYQPIVRQSRDNGERELVSARWGLIPFFTKDMAR